MTPFPRENRENYDNSAGSKIVVFAKRVVTFGSGRRSRIVFLLTFVGQHRTNRLLLRPASDHGCPKIISKVNVSREAAREEIKERKSHKNPSDPSQVGKRDGPKQNIYLAL